MPLQPKANIDPAYTGSARALKEQQDLHAALASAGASDANQVSDSAGETREPRRVRRARARALKEQQDVDKFAAAMMSTLFLRTDFAGAQHDQSHIVR